MAKRFPIGLLLSGALAVACGGSTQSAGGDDDGTAAGGQGGSAGATTSAGGGAGKSGSGGSAGSAGGAVGSGGGAGAAQVDGGAARRSTGCGKAATGGYTASNTINVGGTDRVYALAVSTPYYPDTPIALVFSWHGMGTDGASDRSGYEWNLEKKMKAVFVYPSGINKTWDVKAGSADFKLYEALYTQLADTYCVDLNRVFSLGFSMGAIMTNSLACAYGGPDFRIRGAAPQAGNGPTPPCTGPVAWLGVHGTQDGSVSYASGQASRDFWAKNNGCATTTTPYSPQPTPGPYTGDKQPTCVKYDGCKDGFPVHWCTFDGGHDWQEWPHFLMATFWNALPE